MARKPRPSKPVYRPLTIPERDALFAYYEKHNGNLLAMTRDKDCTFKSWNQLQHYRDLYGFKTKLAESRGRMAEEVMGQLVDSKIMAVRQAVRLIQPRQVPMIMPDGQPFTDADGRPVFMEVYPNHKEIKAAWEIIKTELGEPTTISKAEVNNPQSEEVKHALDVIAQLTTHGGPSNNASAIQGEREAAGDAAPAPAPVQHDTEASASAN